jgi:hypothetical protein
MAPAGLGAHADGMDPKTSCQIEILAEAECFTLLESVAVGRLAIAIMNVPDIFPVNFVVDRGTLVFRTAEGTKLAAAVLGRAVAFEVDGYDSVAGEAWSVVVKGGAIEIEKMYDLFDALDLPLLPWHTGRSIASCGSCRARSRAGDSRLIRQRCITIRSPHREFHHDRWSLSPRPAELGVTRLRWGSDRHFLTLRSTRCDGPVRG